MNEIKSIKKSESKFAIGIEKDESLPTIQFILLNLGFKDNLFMESPDMINPNEEMDKIFLFENDKHTVELFLGKDKAFIVMDSNSSNKKLLENLVK